MFDTQETIQIFHVQERFHLITLLWVASDTTTLNNSLCNGTDVSSIRWVVLKVVIKIEVKRLSGEISGSADDAIGRTVQRRGRGGVNYSGIAHGTRTCAQVLAVQQCTYYILVYCTNFAGDSSYYKVFVTQSRQFYAGKMKNAREH